MPRASYEGVVQVRNPNGVVVLIAPRPGLDLRAAAAQATTGHTLRFHRRTSVLDQA